VTLKERKIGPWTRACSTYLRTSNVLFCKGTSGRLDTYLVAFFFFISLSYSLHGIPRAPMCCVVLRVETTYTVFFVCTSPLYLETLGRGRMTHVCDCNLGEIYRRECNKTKYIVQVQHSNVHATKISTNTHLYSTSDLTLFKAGVSTPTAVPSYSSSLTLPSKDTSTSCRSPSVSSPSSNDMRLIARCPAAAIDVDPPSRLLRPRPKLIGATLRFLPRGFRAFLGDGTNSLSCVTAHSISRTLGVAIGIRSRRRRRHRDRVDEATKKEKKKKERQN
jgi:hypothetical protein